LRQQLTDGADIDIKVIARESIFIYGANLIASLISFLYWVIAAKIVPSTVLGTASTINSLTSIAITVSTLGLGTAILRVGSVYRNEIGRITYTALMLDLIATTLVVLGGLTIYARILDSVRLALLTIPLALAWAPTVVLSPVLIVTRNAKYLPYAQVLNAISRVGLGITVLLTSPTITGVMIGYLLGFLAVVTTLLIIILRKGLLEPHISKTYVVELIRAGIPVWLPSIIAVLGTQLAVVFTYSIRGGSEAGYLYIAQAIALGIDAARGAVSSALIIASSNVDRGRLGDVIRLAFALLLPVNMTLFFFPEPLLKLINPEYLAAVDPLRIYVIANVVLLTIGLVGTHIYASGDYRYTLLINTSTSTTRVVLYTILTPLHGATGAATAYLAGTLTATSLIAPKARGVKAPWSKMSLSLAIISLLGIALKHLTSEHLLTTIMVAVLYLSLAYLVHIVLKLLKKAELIQLLRVFRSMVRAK